MSECLMDFPHVSDWCPPCKALEVQARIANALEEANELNKERMESQLYLFDSDRQWVENHLPAPVVRKPTPKATYTPPPVAPKQHVGGISVEPKI